MRFSRITGAHTRPATTSGSPTGPVSCTVAATVFVAGSMRTSPPPPVTQIASADAAVQPAVSTGIVATILFVAGSTRITPCVPVAQTDPKAPTTPVALPSGHRLTTLFFAGSIRSSSPLPYDVVDAARPVPDVGLPDHPVRLRVDLQQVR